VHPGRLRWELARRGLSERELAREARISAATVSAAMSGRAIAATSLSLIANALLRIPPVEIIDQLLRTDNERLGVD